MSTLIGESEPLAADKAVFTNTLNGYNSTRGSFAFTSVQDNFTMYSSEYYYNFRISASIDTDRGLYYMNTEVVETKLQGAESDLYDPSVKTLIEVFPKQKAVMTVAAIPGIRIGS